MKSTADYLLTSEQAAASALSLLERAGGLFAAAVWGRHEASWQRLASFGPAETLAEPAQLQAGRLPGPDGGSQPLISSEGEIGWLVWRGVPPPETEAVSALLTGQLVSAHMRNELAVSRITHETLLEINQLACECANLESFLPKLHQCMARLMDAQNFQIVLYDEDISAVRFPFYRDSHAAAPTPQESFPLASSKVALPAHLIRHARPLVLTRDNIRALGSGSGFSEAPLPCFWMGVPLFNTAGGVLGGVVVQSYDDQRPFRSTEQSMFLFVARHIGFALNKLLYRAHLERQVWRRTGELEGANSRLRAEMAERQRSEKMQAMLFGIAQLSNTSLSLEAFLAGLHRLLAELIPARNCLLALYHPEDDLLTFPYCADEISPQIQPRRPGRGRIEQVLHSGRPLLLEGDVFPGGEDYFNVPLASWLGVPLYCDHELMGVLAVHSYDAGASYTFRDQEVLEFVANHIGAALARVRALEDLQLAYSELEQRVRERTSELDAVNAQLEFDSLHDPLTKLPNRTYFAKALRRAWDNYGNGGGRFAVLFIDLDRFKLVNDTLGHLAGDHMLYEAGARIRSCLRHYDFLARLGGDEFAVLLFGVNSFETCEMTARRIVSEFERPIILSGREVFTSASVGVVLADKEHYDKAEDLLRDADHAMYCTKQQGRHGYTLFNQELRSNQADQLALESELRRALDEDTQLVPYFQPFINSRSGRLVGFESLVRWRHPTRGLISPAIFLPMAEESGLIMRLDRYMIEASCRQLAVWRQCGQVAPDITLHINLSSANFHDPGLVEWLTELVTQYALPPDTLHLEITESALIDVPDIAVTVMNALTDLGIRLALDDFGTGYSALSYLHRYRFDVLKIDQAFVAEVDHKEESEAIVRAILALAAALNLDVVAEGVETQAQMHKLREMGCAKLQGFLFAEPTPADLIDWRRLEQLVTQSSAA
jgi:diguanylate cyclase (GGDEF)-like protein